MNDMQPDHVGLVLAEDEPTWDSVDVATLALLRAELTQVRVVGLSLATDLEAIRRTVDAVQPAIVNLARAVTHLTPEDVHRLRHVIHPVSVMITIPVRDRLALDLADRFAPVSDWLLLDSADPTTDVVGATGHTHDWSISRQIVERLQVPVILAGGLGPHNVVDANAAVKPAGVDSLTQTSRPEDRRRKDLDRVRRFLALARNAVA